MSKIILFAFLITISLAAFAAAEDSFSRQMERAGSARVDQQPRLYSEIAEREIRSADQWYVADKIEMGRSSVEEAVAAADKSSDAAIRSGKHLKDTEIAMRKMSFKLRDMKRKLPLDDQAPLRDASDHLEQLRTQLLAHMFKGRKK